MHVALWDTRRLGITKDFAGGYGVGQYHGRGGLGGKLIRAMFRRDRRPVAMNFAYLAAIFRRLGHTVEYCEDRLPSRADLVVFNPALATLRAERQAIVQLVSQSPSTQVLITGPVAHSLSETFADLPVTVVRGEPEQLLWKLDEVLTAPSGVVEVGQVENLDDLPFPDWSLFAPRRFRVGYDFSRFPTTFVQLSRGCTLACDYCPYIAAERSARFRDPELVVEEIVAGISQHGFRSFKFRDPLFGLDRERTLELAHKLARLPLKIQFSIESRIELLGRDLLEPLVEAGLTSVTFGVETPDQTTLRSHQRTPTSNDRSQAFIETCRDLGIRTVAGFMIGFPQDTPRTIRNVLHHAKQLNPTFANFNIVTPYPGTHFYEQIKTEIASFDFSRYDVYTPVLQYKNLTQDELLDLHARCFVGYYFRWPYLATSAPLLWPLLKHFGIGRKPAKKASKLPTQPAIPRPALLRNRAHRSEARRGGETSRVE
jgi:anaerobic magnesium-protoporphyrin IX monomethyl ester cyclase